MTRKHAATYKCRVCGRFDDLDETDTCQHCAGDYILGLCKNCDLHEQLTDGKICHRCEGDGHRCWSCGIWIKVKFMWSPSEQCSKCSKTFCVKCVGKHYRQSCRSCSKKECPSRLRKCKACKKKICYDCSQYCTTCWIKLLAMRHKIIMPRDIINIFRVLNQGKRPNSLTKCRHEVEPGPYNRCSGCRQLLCLNCDCLHYRTDCPKCHMRMCGSTYWRTCFGCSRTICDKCPSGSSGIACACRDLVIEDDVSGSDW